MSSPLRKHRFFLVAVSLLLLSLAFLSWDVSSPNPASPIERAALKVLYLPLKAFNLFFQGLSSLFDKYLFLVDLNDENRFLQEEIQRLRNDNRFLQMKERENERLRSLLELRERAPLKTVAAEIIGEDPLGLYKTITIDKGSRWGIKPGSAVISARGVVGRVLDAGENISKILLMVDKNSSIDAMIERTYSRGIIEGSGFGHCELKYVSIGEDVRVGDHVVCSGLGGVFPKGWSIGTVARVDKKGGTLFQEIEVSPSVNFSQIREVLVTIN